MDNITQPSVPIATAGSHSDSSRSADRLKASNVKIDAALNTPAEETFNLAADVSLNDIAIIGMSGRFPGADSIKDYWENLSSGRDCIHVFSDEELAKVGVSPELMNQPNYVKAAGVISDPDCFDAAFFGFSPREAEIMDPQHRLFLEQAWTALEHTGYNPHTYDGAIALFAGVGLNTYLLKCIYPHLLSDRDLDTYQVQLRNDKDFLPTLISYKLDLRGPSLSVQTACSTSLVATHLACQSLLNGESDMALAGGVTVYANPTGYLYTEGMIMSPDGHCRAFDAQAQGTVGGNGVGIVVLKRLEDAIADRDTIHAVIKGSAINNDGSDKVGFTAPSVEGQAAVIAEAQAIAQVPADTVSYVEAHGTGTVLGDPIEISALNQAFRHTTDRNQFCAIGSVKTNIGHLDTAAGVASLIKVALSLKHQTLPPSLHFKAPNPTIDFAQSPFFVNDRLSPWKTDGTPRRAGVSGFGIGGTNAHIVLEEAPAVEPTEAIAAPHLLVLSARSQTALDRQQQNLAAHLRAYPELSLTDVAWTLADGRKGFDYRRVCLARSVSEAAEQLEAGPLRSQTVSSDRTPIAFLFPGQGSQTLDMGKDLYAQEPVFQEVLDQCAELLLPYLKKDIRALLGIATHNAANNPVADESIDNHSGAEKNESLIHQTRWAQPLLFAVEYALAQLWISWGIKPEAMLGHSLGEYVAACIADVLSLPEALRLIAHRAQLMQTLPPGAMLAVPGTEADLQPFLADGVTLAASNGAICTLSGTTEAIAQIETQLTEAGRLPKRLQTAHAFHSPLVEPMIPAFRALLHTIDWQPPQQAYLSNVSGTWITAAEATDPDYWIRHLRQTVRFGEACAQLITDPDWIFLEVGPGRSLTALLRRHPDYQQQPLINSLQAPKEAAPESPWLTALGNLWLAGATINWFKIYGQGRRIPLPTYPFERQRYWLEPPEIDPLSVAPTPTQSLFKSQAQGDVYVRNWQQWRSSAPKSVRETESQCWLILMDEQGLGEAIAQCLKAAGHEVITATCTNHWRTPKADYTLTLGSSGDIFSLLQTLKEKGQFPQQVLHLWSFSQHAEQLSQLAPESNVIDEQIKRGLTTLTVLTKALEKINQSQAQVQLTVLTSGLYSVIGNESLCPLSSLLAGSVRNAQQTIAQQTIAQQTIAQQTTARSSSQIRCRIIDIGEPNAQRFTQMGWIEALLRDVTDRAAPTELAYRGRSRWQPTAELLTLPTVPAQHRQGGVYLLVGDLGEVDFAIARVLTKAAQSCLVVLHHSPLPERERWAERRESASASDPVARKIEQILALEATGTTIRTAQISHSYADIASQITDAQTQFGTINGVICTLEAAPERSAHSCLDAIQQAINAISALERALGDHGPSFWIYNITDSAQNQSAEAVVMRAYLEAVCGAKQNQETFSVVIDWTQTSADNTDNEDIFARILNQPSDFPSSYQVAPVTAQRSAKQTAAELPNFSKTQLSSPAAQPGHPQQARTAFVAPRNQLEVLLVEEWSSFLKIPSIGIHDSFYDIGGDSLMVLGLLSQIKQRLSIEVPLAALVETPTVAGLADYLKVHAADAVSEWLIPTEAEAIAPDPAQKQPSIPSLLIQPHLPKTEEPLVACLKQSSASSENSGRPPLFLVHPIGGGISCYTPLLTHLSSEQSLYGIRALGLEGATPPLEDIAQIAQRYIKAIRQNYPEGPLLLGGWSMGGLVAYEMARQLAVNNDNSVEGLILVDSPTAISEQGDPVMDFVVFARGLGFSQAYVSPMADQLQQHSDRLEAILCQLLQDGQQQGLLPNGFSLRSLQRLHRVISAHSLALSRYSIAAYPGSLPTLLIEAQNNPADRESLSSGQASPSWQQIVGAGLQTHELSGDHYSIVNEPQAAILAQKINLFLEQTFKLTEPNPAGPN